MMNYGKLFEVFDLLFPSVTRYDESWGFLTMKGKYADGVLVHLIELNTCLLNNGITLKLDNENFTTDDIQAYRDEIQFKTWELNINKNFSEQLSINYFYKTDKLSVWLGQLSAFDTQNPFNRYSKFRIIVGDIDKDIQGVSFSIQRVSNIEQDNFWEDSKLPDKNSIHSIVRIISNDDLLISPINFIYKTDSNSNIVAQLRRLAIISLAASIVSEIISPDKISLDGIRKIYIKLFESTDDFSEETYLDLITAVTWIYEEKTSTRARLFYDRITLEIDETKSYINGLNTHIKSSLQQAKHRYNFLILERKEKYISELKDLLKDIRTQSDLYSQKIRNLLNNLLRDVLAAIVLVGFTLFTKLSDNLQLDKADLIKYVFCTLAIYYIASIILQCIVDLVDIHVSKKEMLYWKTTANELLPSGEVEAMIEESLKSRRTSLRVIYPLISIFYFAIAIACFCFPNYFHNATSNKYSTSNYQVKNQNGLPNSKQQKINDSISKYKVKTGSSSSSRKQDK